MANMSGQLPPVPRITKTGFADPVWPRWLNELRNRVVAAIVSVKIATANGFTGSVVEDPAGNSVITLGITVSGMLKGVGGALASAIPGVDFVQTLSTSAPVMNSGTAANPVISMPQSNTSTDGWLGHADWNTFNNKVDTVSATSPMSSTGGKTPVLSMTQAGTSSNGWLSSTDWNTFNGKLNGAGTTPGTYTKVTVASSGLVTSGTQLNASDVTTALTYTPLNPANNLSDVASPATSRTNLGLGTIATQNAASVAITGGAINGTSIGATAAASGKFTTLDAAGNDALSYNNTSAQSIPNNTNTTITNWTQRFDRLGANFNAATGVFTAPAAGFYAVTLSLQYNGVSPAGTEVRAKIYQNGLAIYSAANEVGSGGSVTNAWVAVTGLVNCAAGDTITAVTSQTSGGALPLITTAALVFLHIHKVP